MAHNPIDKIHALDAIEKEIITCMQSAGSPKHSYTFKFHIYPEFIPLYNDIL